MCKFCIFVETTQNIETMKKEINNRLMLGATVVLLLNFTSCKKYEEGPTFSLRSKTARLTGEWTLDDLDASKDENDFVEVVEHFDAEITCEFEKEGDFKMELEGEYQYSGGTLIIIGEAEAEWEWSADKESVDIEFDGNLDVTFKYNGSTYSGYYMDLDDEEFEITRLTNDELKFEDDDGNEWTCIKEK